MQHPSYDIWVQDAMEFGYSTMPSRMGLRSIASVLRAPRGMALDSWTQEHALAPNFGYVAKGSKRNNVGWIDWFGNLDCTPPLPGWPLGRIYTGYQGTLTIHPAVLEFLDAQYVQGPVLQIDTGWLLIGHVDEEICFVPSKVGTPYRMLVPSTAMTISILQGLAAAGKGQLAVFCPACGKAVERLVSAGAVHGKYSTRSDSKLKDLGLTKYVKTSDGSYERTVGRGGPKMIREPEG